MNQLMNKSLFTLLFFWGFVKTTCSQNVDNLIENKIILESAILGEKRTCFIDLPDSYTDLSLADKKYPVIVLLDGNTFFKTVIGIVTFMSSVRNQNQIIPESIVVAIENVDRERDFTVTKLKTKRPNTMGGGQLFLNFIQKELIPYIDKNFRTEPTRTLIGHSLGGLLTLNAFMDQNNIFNAYISIDPSIWWEEKEMKLKIESITSKSKNKKLNIATANQGEIYYHRNKKRHDIFYALLKEKFGESLNVNIEYFEHENHRSVPKTAIRNGLKCINQNY